MPVAGVPPSQLGRAEGRQLFGLDPAGYDAGRPDYPEWVYDCLSVPGRLREGSRVVEVGPGTGIVTRRLLSAGARVVAIEPDPALARRLADAFAGRHLEIVNAPFEESGLADDSAELIVAATSFHWVEREIGMRTVPGCFAPADTSRCGGPCSSIRRDLTPSAMPPGICSCHFRQSSPRQGGLSSNSMSNAAVATS